jgi:ABC-type transport system involved in Fe-S cluster assembly fused permease/ATPase subunit
MTTPSSSMLTLAVTHFWSASDLFARRLLVITLLLVLGSSILAGLAPALLKAIVDRLEPRGVDPAYGTSLCLIVGYASVHWMMTSLGELRDMFCGRADQRIQRRMSFTLFWHVMSLPLCFHLQRKTGALIQVLANGLMGYRMLLHHIAMTILPIVVELVTMCTVLLILDRGEFLVIIGISAFFCAVVFWTGIRRIGNPARAVSTARINASAVLTDSILNYETIKYFGGESEVHRRFGEALISTEDNWDRLYRRKLENGLAVAGIFAVSLGILVYCAARDVQQGRMSVGEFVLVNAYVLRITLPLEAIGFAFRDIAEGMAWVADMTKLLGERREADTVEAPAVVPPGPLGVAFARVSYSYPGDGDVIRDVTFMVPAGKSIAIVGSSGSGKSSLIRLLVRVVEPREGLIFLNGTPLSNIAKATLRTVIAVVPQDIALFNDTIAYNIGFGRKGSTSAEIVRAAKIAHIHDFIIGLPDGYETKVGERGITLSGGEKQRVAIARAVIREPRIFIFDEGTSSLDAETEQAILNDLERVLSSTTKFIIAHRLSNVVHADEIIVLSRGRIVEYGTHSELLRRGGAYTAMWRAQSRFSV